MRHINIRELRKNIKAQLDDLPVAITVHGIVVAEITRVEGNKRVHKPAGVHNKGVHKASSVHKSEDKGVHKKEVSTQVKLERKVDAAGKMEARAVKGEIKLPFDICPKCGVMNNRCVC